jgi:hypothetical protein
MIREIYNSGNLELNPESFSATQIYKLSWQDFWRRWGIFVDGDGNNRGAIELPYIGMPYGWYSNLVCSSIQVTKTEAKEGWDNSGMDLDRICDVNYVWSNSASTNDMVRVNSASSWKLEFSSNIEDRDVTQYEDLSIKSTNPEDPDLFVIDWEDKWFTYKFGTVWTNLTDDQKADFRDNHGVPPLNMRYIHTMFTFTFYTDRIKDFEYYRGRINTDDFIFDLYERRELALRNQTKNPTYTYNEFINKNHFEQWMLLEINHEEISPLIHQYQLVFEKSNSSSGWNYNYGVDTNRYSQAEMYKIVEGIDSVTAINTY